MVVKGGGKEEEEEEEEEKGVSPSARCIFLLLAYTYSSIEKRKKYYSWYTT